jgi:hypothetical protein
MVEEKAARKNYIYTWSQLASILISTSPCEMRKAGKNCPALNCCIPVERRHTEPPIYIYNGLALGGCGIGRLLRARIRKHYRIHSVLLNVSTYFIACISNSQAFMYLSLP